MNPVSVDPEVVSGTPCFTGTRVPVKNLFDYLERDYTLEEFLSDFPGVPREQAIEVLTLARQKLLMEAGDAA